MKTLEDLARDAVETVASGYYQKLPKTRLGPGESILKSILSKGGRAIICEIKFASPSAGKIDGRYDQVARIAKEMELGGAAGLSVLTEPKNFNGSIANLATAKASTRLPIIMKDVIVSRDQIVAAVEIGASAVLFIWELFHANYSVDLTLQDAIRVAKESGLEVIVETHSREGLAEISKLDGCDIIGINNRDLKTFRTSIDTTVDLLGESKFDDSPLIMSESGYETAADISHVISKLKSAGGSVPKAFLVGTSIMKSSDVKAKVSEFTRSVEAYSSVRN